jgi:hypothetical protein
MDLLNATCFDSGSPGRCDQEWGLRAQKVAEKYSLDRIGGLHTVDIRA